MRSCGLAGFSYVQRRVLPMARMCAVTLSFAVLLQTAPASAWDGEHEGFVLGLGLGGVMLKPEDPDAGVFGAFALDFKIGYAPSQTISLYFIERMSIGLGDDAPVAGWSVSASPTRSSTRRPDFSCMPAPDCWASTESASG